MIVCKRLKQVFLKILWAPQLLHKNIIESILKANKRPRARKFFKNKTQTQFDFYSSFMPRFSPGAPFRSIKLEQAIKVKPLMGSGESFSGQMFALNKKTENIIHDCSQKKLSTLFPLEIITLWLITHCFKNFIWLILLFVSLYRLSSSQCCGFSLQ